MIPAIALDTPIVPAGSRVVSINGRRYREWLAPDRRAAGWHPSSARAGAPGNMVLSGHNNIAGAVFRRLADLKLGDRIWIYTRDRVFPYEVVELHILPERGQPLAVRQANARWIQPTPDERLTLVTCWPPWSNSHRLIVIAHPSHSP
ncbi:sortase [Thermoflexus sp.]|uniref:sortase n=1 Tax=Thermoflexus sp. TaxID=1969742 RepID=UPI0035E464BE